MVERENSDRTFLVYNKKIHHQRTRQKVRKFAAHFQKEIYNILSPESITTITKKVTQIMYYHTEQSQNIKLSNAVLSYTDKLKSNP